MTDPITDFKTNALAIAAKPLLDALTSIQANPTTFNVLAQGVALQGALVGAAPTLESLGIKDVAAALQQQIQAVLTGSTSAPPVAAPATPPAA